MSLLAALADRLDPPVALDPWADVESTEEVVAQLRALFPAYCSAPFGDHHLQLWEWVRSIRLGERPDPLVCIWPRGGAKSTSAELACVVLGGRGVRRYGLYISGVQESADDHVGNVGALLESASVERVWPQMAERRLGKYGNSKGWRVNRLRTASGFTLDAVGLDTAARGVKLEDARPDFMVIDDVDGETDSPATTEKRITVLTRALLPAGSNDLAVLAIQNLVHADSVFARLAGRGDQPADFLARRTVSGPIPAVEGLVTEADERGRRIITAGEASWAGQPLETCQAQIDDWGISAFLAEAQHEVSERKGKMFDHLDYQHCTWDEVPPLVRVVVWVDPAVTSTDDSDSQGIQSDGISGNGTIYRLRSWEQRTTPEDALARAIHWAYELGADHVGVETDQGGDTWRSVYARALDAVLEANPSWRRMPRPGFVHDKAGAGAGPKAHRASKMLADYERPGRIVHVIGTHEVLERALTRFPRFKPLDLVDGAYWSWQDLREERGVYTPVSPTGVGEAGGWSPGSEYATAGGWAP